MGIFEWEEEVEDIGPCKKCGSTTIEVVSTNSVIIERTDPDILNEKIKITDETERFADGDFEFVCFECGNAL